MRIDIAKEVAACVKQLDGTVLDEVLKDPGFKNADYWFSEANVLAELKCLSDDLVSNKTFNQNVAILYGSWVKRGLVPQTSAKSVRLSLQALPENCALEFLDLIKKKLDAGAIKKANRQIRETKKKFATPDAKGLLLLVNDGNLVLPPGVMAYLLSRILKGKHSSIHSVIYFSVNVNSTIPGFNAHGQFWIDSLIPERDPVAPEFRKAFRAAWFSHLSSLGLGPVIELDGKGSSELLNGIQFAKGS